MIKKIDRYIISRLFGITLFMLLMLIIIFIIFDFSENSEDFTDKGATFAEIFGVYYLNYIPEIIRLIIPVAVFIACLYLTGQMTERLEIIALKAAGVSLYRLLVPYLIFGFIITGITSYMDGFVIPDANKKRIAFESEYLQGKSEKVDGNQLFRQESDQTIFKIGFYNAEENIGHRIDATTFAGDSISQTMYIQRMIWSEEQQLWKLENIDKRIMTPRGYQHVYIDSMDTTLNIYPRDLARTTSDIYQLTYPKARDYIQSIERSGAGNVESPKVQLYGRYAYPFSVIVVIIVGFSLASVRRKGGKGFYIASGLGVSFLYLAMMKVIEPFGGTGDIPPIVAALIPHLFFLLLGLGILYNARK
ncbi:LptF/LptG family permease [Fodinibius sediminis]|uniref:Lipopolysaccharide export system permease protein n=1 Tax=Fodinibius sediminis TaxID=1214077 RepID=A0A521BU80_9BACT|nr:LptF/LptG family permease [Fodinibius sediminis]SMO50717.1 lipopolysaccharide export system permease protein [Fodinibius sediminis]